MKFEASSFELDPSYDPERLEGSVEQLKEQAPRDSGEIVAKQPIARAPVYTVSIRDYTFDTTTNPFAFDAVEPLSIGPIADAIDTAIRTHVAIDRPALVRGIQAGKHGGHTRQELVSSILVNGSDHYDTTHATDLHAAPYADGTIASILGGFHVWKPKCEDRPQHIVDIWMVFDASAFDNIEYMHPRHHVIAHDRWRLRGTNDKGLVAVIVVN